MEYKTLNLNSQIKVKLTSYGKDRLKIDHDKFQEKWKEPKYRTPFRLPEEDEEGWSTWQLHVLMEELGKYCHIGNNPPFETNIKINTADLKR